MKSLGLILLSVAAFAQTDKLNDVRDRGQTRPPDNSQSWTRGRIGTQQPIPYKLQDYSGILVDAACDDRSSLNLRQQPEPPQIARPVAAPQTDTGIKVDPKTLQRERADVLEHQNADVLLRQPDRSCSITGATRGFALLMSNGRLVNLDEGGNTLALQALQSTTAGRAVLNGTGSGIKPDVTIRGRVDGDRLVVNEVLKTTGGK